MPEVSEHPMKVCCQDATHYANQEDFVKCPECGQEWELRIVSTFAWKEVSA